MHLLFFIVCSRRLFSTPSGNNFFFVYFYLLIVRLFVAFQLQLLQFICCVILYKMLLYSMQLKNALKLHFSCWNSVSGRSLWGVQTMQKTIYWTKKKQTNRDRMNIIHFGSFGVVNTHRCMHPLHMSKKALRFDAPFFSTFRFIFNGMQQCSTIFNGIMACVWFFLLASRSVSLSHVSFIFSVAIFFPWSFCF